MIEAGIVDCMVALPAQLFYNTMIPACLWFLARDRSTGGVHSRLDFRNRSNEILFIDARKLGTMVTRRNRAFTDEDIAKISGTYHAWRGEGGKYADVPGFCKAATLDEVRANNYVLMPGRYVGTEEAEDDGVPFEEKMATLTAQLAEQFAKGIELQERIRENLKELAMTSNLESCHLQITRNNRDLKEARLAHRQLGELKGFAVSIPNQSILIETPGITRSEVQFSD